MLSFLAFWMGGAAAPSTPELPDSSGDRRRRRPEVRPERARLREDIIREERMIAEYVEQLERKQTRLAMAPARERKKATREIPVPRLTDAMARAASAQQLMAVIRSASAAELDRQRAVEEEHRRRRTLLLLLALD